MFNYSEYYSNFKWIKVKIYQMDESLSWEQRYEKLDAHHIEETSFLIEEICKLAKQLDDFQVDKST